ncbi:hypothetical protein CK203_058725 [Vitis vinifera]|uniref:Reverse transcriptase Ty1/copia-type domain-containing protein n=1 Tax=Vitis vinifera TaxID=29760 RepID=A0A438GLI7_VITVI|nr:hypothetical protein CK203_058725 [Vitis vinifera]
MRLLEDKALSNGCQECFSKWYSSEEVYVEQPKRFEDLNFLNHVYRLKKALYGLNQASRAWYGRLITYLLEKKVEREGVEESCL